MKENKSMFWVMLFMLVLGTVQLQAAALNPFEFLKDAFFELATNYVFLILIALIFIGSCIAAYKEQNLTFVWWGLGAIGAIAMIPTLAPGVMEFFKSYAPSNTVVVP